MHKVSCSIPGIFLKQRSPNHSSAALEKSNPQCVGSLPFCAAAFSLPLLSSQKVALASHLHQEIQVQNLLEWWAAEVASWNNFLRSEGKIMGSSATHTREEVLQVPDPVGRAGLGICCSKAWGRDLCPRPWRVTVGQSGQYWNKSTVCAHMPVTASLSRF